MEDGITCTIINSNYFHFAITFKAALNNILHEQWIKRLCVMRQVLLIEEIF